MRLNLLKGALFAALSLTAVGQTARDFKQRYESHDFLEVRPNILMKPEYNSKGEVCSVFFQPNHYSIKEKTVFVGNSSIDLHDLLDVIDELAPPKARTGKGSSLGYVVQGGIMSGGFTFDNIRINAKRGFGEKGGRSIRKRLAGEGGLIDFLNSFGAPETASISWITRTGCGENDE